MLVWIEMSEEKTIWAYTGNTGRADGGESHRVEDGGKCDRGTGGGARAVCFAARHIYVRRALCSGMRASGCRVQDRKSSNGTFLNGARISEAMLANGDEIKGGQTIFKVKIVADAKLASMVPPHDVAPPVATPQRSREPEPVVPPDVSRQPQQLQQPQQPRQGVAEPAAPPVSPRQRATEPPLEARPQGPPSIPELRPRAAEPAVPSAPEAPRPAVEPAQPPAPDFRPRVAEPAQPSAPAAPPRFAETPDIEEPAIRIVSELRPAAVPSESLMMWSIPVRRGMALSHLLKV